MSNFIKQNLHDDFPSIFIELIKKINFKVAFFLYFIGVIIFSDVFIENILSKNMINGDCADSKGTMIQLLVLVSAYILIDILVKYQVI